MLIIFAAVLSHAMEESPSLKFLISGNVVNEITLDDMKSELKVHRIELFDHLHRKKKKYKGFTLKDVIQLGFGDEWKNPGFTDAAFQALDGYVAVSSTSKLSEPGGYIVFRDLDIQDWEPIGKKQSNPGPFYLVWTGKEQIIKNEYPWPWQIASVDLVTFEDQYSVVSPKGAGEDSQAFKGYQIFKRRCIMCHSINQKGGKIGPDLNAPRSIVSYRSASMIKEFIKNPSKYRHTLMPDHPDLSNQDLDNLISYFNYMNENRD